MVVSLRAVLDKPETLKGSGRNPEIGGRNLAVNNRRKLRLKIAVARTFDDLNRIQIQSKLLDRMGIMDGLLALAAVSADNIGANALEESNRTSVEPTWGRLGPKKASSDPRAGAMALTTYLHIPNYGKAVTAIGCNGQNFQAMQKHVPENLQCFDREIQR